MKNYYDVLGVSPNSETEVITAAYKAMMRKYHPDTNKSAQAAERAKEINEAYEVLKNPLSRREYDAKMGHTSSPEAQSPNPPPPPPPAASDQVPDPKGGGEKTPFVGEQGQLRVWVIFAAAYITIALLYYGPNWISASLQVRPLDFAAQVAGAATLPFALGFGISRLWRALSSSAPEPKTDRLRWLTIQFVFIAILVFNKSMLEKAKEDEAAAATQPASLNQAATTEDTSKCHTAFEAQNWKEAWTFCPVSAESGDAISQSMIGYMHDQGLGAPKNAVEAVKWFRKAAEQGEVTAQSNLAIAYENGTGVAQNPSEAILWYRKAAEQGDEGAKKRLSELSENSSLGGASPQNTVSSGSGSEALKMDRSSNWSSDVRRLTSEIVSGKINVRFMNVDYATRGSRRANILGEKYSYTFNDAQVSMVEAYNIWWVSRNMLFVRFNNFSVNKMNAAVFSLSRADCGAESGNPIYLNLEFDRAMNPGEYAVYAGELPFNFSEEFSGGTKCGLVQEAYGQFR